MIQSYFLFFLQEMFNMYKSVWFLGTENGSKWMTKTGKKKLSLYNEDGINNLKSLTSAL